MKTAFVRSIGFSLPTVTFDLVLHLAKEQTVGEAIDGVVSGLWFTGMFLMGVLLSADRLLVSRGRGTVLRDLLRGIAAALRAHAFFGFALNSATMFAVGFGSGILAMRRSVPA